MIRAILIMLFTCASFLGLAQVGIITTIAGTGIGGYNGDNIPASNAQLNWPSNIRADKNGNLLIVDPDNARLRKIATSGIITTIAGSGTIGFAGDNEQATNAKLYAPQGVCTDSIGNIYISDGGNHRIRKIGLDGIISTIAGDGIAAYNGDENFAIEAELNGPCGLFVFGESLFIADYYNEVVRKIDLLTNIITTVAGNGIAGYQGDNGLATAAKLNGPEDVFCDAGGNLFIADQMNGAVRRVDAITGIITTVAGNGTLGHSGDNGPATAAQMNEATGVFVDKYNNLYITDYRNGAIRKVDAGGIITTVVGGSAGYGGDGAPATDAKLKCVDIWVDNGENIFIADYANHRIRKVNGALKVLNYQFNEFALSAVPNPTSGKFEIQCPANEGIVTVYDMAGRIVYQSAIFTAKTKMDIADQPPGMYMVYVQSGEDRYVSKVLLQ